MVEHHHWDGSVLLNIIIYQFKKMGRFVNEVGTHCKQETEEEVLCLDGLHFTLKAGLDLRWNSPE